MCIVVILATAFAATPEPGAPEGQPITFSKFVLEVEDQVVAQSTAPERSFVLSRLRDAELNVVGGESPVFDRDESGGARFALGATIRDGEWRQYPRYRELQFRFDWELLDLESDNIVYTTSIVAYTSKLGSANKSGSRLTRSEINELFDQGMSGLLRRESFLELLEPLAETQSDAGGLAAVTWEPLTLMACGATRALPDDLGAAQSSAVSIQHRRETLGTGVFVSSDGFVLTAAHVVDGVENPSVKLRAGPRVRARVLRVDVDHDLALLKAPGEGFVCSPLATREPTSGAEVWAVGTPLGEDELELSVSKGIVSGNRDMGPLRLIQTDASISPGFSGGPMLLADGTIGGIAMSKLVGHGVEGVGFAVPSSTVSERLALAFAKGSDDVEDWTLQTLTPEAPPRKRLDDVRDRGRMGELTPSLRSTLKRNGTIMAGVGAATATTGLALSIGALAGWTSNNTKTESQRATLRGIDLVGVSLLVVGGATATIGGLNVANP